MSGELVYSWRGTISDDEMVELVDSHGRRSWLHVDFEPHLRDFYLEACGFRPTDAGLIHLRPEGFAAW